MKVIILKVKFIDKNYYYYNWDLSGEKSQLMITRLNQIKSAHNITEDEKIKFVESRTRKSVNVRSFKSKQNFYNCH